MKTLRPSVIAQYCDVHHRTVSRWISQGRLKGHKLPGRGNYRVLLDDFILFLQQQKMPMPEELMSYCEDIETDSDSGSASPKRILIIDDETEIRNAIRRVLSSSGYYFSFAADGFHAGVKLLSDKPDLITLDLAMPSLDGFEVLQFIRQQPELAELKILVLSGLSEHELQKALDLGADAVLSKPFDNDKLRSLVNSLLING
ncbi:MULTISPECIES: response regulator [unclassified Shewanella]|jgi:two-component system response regulator VicR|uniref:response regulator n=1 Tax=unclassified Shewanella TaxID=196818 RepID=UPI000C33D2FB|nr:MULTISPECIES: response regulator [unclassified Shewanella]PKH32682.1 response regulator [Shewanella sp. ALD9]QHS13595.1 response regulator [Shewanella sp. Arc9-LZ]|tara:strand:- start:4174 stop:4776 length:603 start_codon:yes stop_codon:yes gene_type:complete